MPFLSKKFFRGDSKAEVNRTIVWFHYRRWGHDKNPLIIIPFTYDKYVSGINIRYLNPQTATKIRKTLTELKSDNRRTPRSTYKHLVTKHPIAKNAFRKYFLKYIVVLGKWQIPLLNDEEARIKTNQKQPPIYHPSEKGRDVPQGLTKP